jgi:hypothetical protein
LKDSCSLVEDSIRKPSRPKEILIRDAKKSHVVWWSNHEDTKACGNGAVGGGDEGRGGDGEVAPSPCELIWVESINKKDPFSTMCLGSGKKDLPLSE